ncbi:MAG: carbohydrate ABC transporter permease [Lachnospirales bacterium]
MSYTKFLKIKIKVEYLLLIIFAVCFVLPLVWVFAASVDPNALQTIKMPDEITLDNYKSIISDPVNVRSFVIGLAMSLSQAFFVVIIGGIAAYPLSRYRLNFKQKFMFSVLFLNSLPITALMVPVYTLFVSINFYDKNYGVVIFKIATSLPYAIWMLKNFMDSVPVTLEEAAWIDGASTMEGIRRIVTPLMLPGIATVAIFTFSGSWGDFFVPYILLNTPEKFPASLKLYQFFGQYGMVQYGELAAFSVLYSMPSVVLYMVSQKYMSQGFTMSGAAKG